MAAGSIIVWLGALETSEAKGGTSEDYNDNTSGPVDHHSDCGGGFLQLWHPSQCTELVGQHTDG